MPLVLKTLKTFFLAKMRNRYYRIHTCFNPMPPDIPLCGLRAAPPPPRPSWQVTHGPWGFLATSL